jgi:hypothetical protein
MRRGPLAAAENLLEPAKPNVAATCLLLPALHAAYDEIAHAAAIIVDVGLAPATLHRELDAAIEAPVNRRWPLAKSCCSFLQLLSLLLLWLLLLLSNAWDC